MTAVIKNATKRDIEKALRNADRIFCKQRPLPLGDYFAGYLKRQPIIHRMKDGSHTVATDMVFDRHWSRELYGAPLRYML